MSQVDEYNTLLERIEDKSDKLAAATDKISNDPSQEDFESGFHYLNIAESYLDIVQNNLNDYIKEEPELLNERLDRFEEVTKGYLYAKEEFLRVGEEYRRNEMMKQREQGLQELDINPDDLAGFGGPGGPAPSGGPSI